VPLRQEGSGASDVSEEKKGISVVILKERVAAGKEAHKKRGAAGRKEGRPVPAAEGGMGGREGGGFSKGWDPPLY